MSGSEYQNGSGALTATRSTPPRQSDVLRHQLAAMAGEFKNALPSHIKPEKFQRVVMTVAQQNPDLLDADRKTLLASCIKCAADGLIPDGREAALVIFNTKVKQEGAPEKWVKAVQYMPMIAGIQKRIRNSGEIASLEAHVIYSEDHFVWRQGLDGSLEHAPKFPGSRGHIIGAYAVAKFKDGSPPQFEVLDIDAINKVRAVSRSKDRGPWVDWFDEMARKTVARRLAKWLPMNADVDDLIRQDEEADAPGAEQPAPTVEGHAEEVAAPSKLDVLEATIAPGDAIEGEIVRETSAGLFDAGSDDPEGGPLTDLRDMLAQCATVKALDQCMQGATWKDALAKLLPEEKDALRADVAARQKALRGAAA